MDLFSAQKCAVCFLRGGVTLVYSSTQNCKCTLYSSWRGIGDVFFHSKLHVHPVSFAAGYKDLFSHSDIFPSQKGNMVFYPDHVNQPDQHSDIEVRLWHISDS